MPKAGDAHASENSDLAGLRSSRHDANIVMQCQCATAAVPVSIGLNQCPKLPTKPTNGTEISDGPSIRLCPGMRLHKV